MSEKEKINMIVAVGLTILCLLAIGFWVINSMHGKHSYKDNVAYVIDGDSLQLHNSGEVRLKNIDAYEWDTEKGREAEEYVHELLEDCDWVQVTTRGKHGYYDRLLAEIKNCRGINIGKALLNKDLAVPYRK
jgi:endonuclease YncB( thermonuclease family)